MKTVFICQGLQASGKSTYCDKWVREKDNRVIISKDGIRDMIGAPFTQENNLLVRTIFKNALISAMMGGFEIIIDNTNLYQKHVDEIINIIKEHNKYPAYESYGWEFVRFYSELRTCCQRDYSRPKPVGEEVITKFYLDNKALLDTFDPYHNPISLIPCFVECRVGIELIHKLFCETEEAFKSLIDDLEYRAKDEKEISIRDYNGVLLYLKTVEGEISGALKNI